MPHMICYKSTCTTDNVQCFFSILHDSFGKDLTLKVLEVKRLLLLTVGFYGSTHEFMKLLDSDLLSTITHLETNDFMKDVQCLVLVRRNQCKIPVAWLDIYAWYYFNLYQISHNTSTFAIHLCTNTLYSNKLIKIVI